MFPDRRGFLGRGREADGAAVSVIAQFSPLLGGQVLRRPPGECGLASGYERSSVHRCGKALVSSSEAAGLSVTLSNQDWG